MLKIIKTAVVVLSVIIILPMCGVYAADVPSVSGKSAILIEGATGTSVFEKNADEKLPMASTTKIMTALVAIERGNLSAVVRVNGNAANVEGSSVYLKAGEELTLENLVYALMLESANDAAAAIAYELGGSIEAFAELMNDTARRIGLGSTHFTNPHGLDDPEHYTTARDLASLASYALKNETFAKIVSTYKKTIPLSGGEGVRLLINHNKLLRSYDDAVGVKTGFTKKSGRCLVSAAERGGVTMIAVTLNASDDWRDHREMLDYGFTKFTLAEIAYAGEIQYELPCTGGNADSVMLTNRDALTAVLPVDCVLQNAVIECPHFIFAPVTEGDVCGRAVCYKDGRLIAEVPLYAVTGVAKVEESSGIKSLLDKLFG